jgi:endonuclease/exonuclease/phosphatase family metal-dependent hydrolase
MHTLKIATYNIHKGYSQFKRRFVLHALRERLRELNADIVFLQEVQGADRRNRPRHHFDGAHPQHEFMAHESWLHHAYGKNSVYDSGDHGNAILSRYPILNWDNQDISAHRFESRGVLHCEMSIPGSDKTLHSLCVHLGLFARGRGQQMEELVKRVQDVIPADAPLIIAGDFNDWNNNAGQLLAQKLNLQEAFEGKLGKLARSYPCGFPMLRMDRIYVRGLDVQQVEVHSRSPWNKISDHAALSAILNFPSVSIK